MTKNREAQWAVALAATTASVVTLAGVVFGVAYLVGGSSAVSDNWVGFLTAISLLGGLIVSPVAFVLAITSRIRHGKSAWLWLPLVLFPALLAFVILGEIFWWE